MSVIIVGGGPVGLVASLVLSTLEVPNIVIEQERSVYGLPRAIVMDAEIRHSLNRIGLTDGLDQLLEPMREADFVDAAGVRLTGIDLTDVKLFGVAAVSKHFQPMLDSYLRSQVIAKGGGLILGSRAISHDQNGDEVTVELDDGSTHTAKYLLACDGASSDVRKRERIPLRDLGFDQDWLVVDLEIHDRADASLPDVTRQVCDAARPTTLVSGYRNYYRFEFQLQPGEDPKAMNTEQVVWKLLERWVRPDQATVIRRACYRFHAVVAETLRKGRVLIAGDAAHQMPPFMGQGLNSGMRDAFNVGWKLAYVLRGSSSETLLETYSDERIAHVQSAIEQSVETGKLIDQLAGRTSHGVGVDAGYGGTRRPAGFERGVVCGEAQQRGQPYPFWNQFPEHRADAFLVLSSDESTTDVKLPPGLVIRKRVDRMLSLGYDHLVVRPDGYVAAGCRSDELAEVVGMLDERLCLVR